MNYFNIKQFENFLVNICNQYEKSAPTVSDYADDLYVRFQESPESVSIVEVMQVSRLLENDIWMQPNHAANFIYKLMHDLNMSTIGHAGF